MIKQIEKGKYKITVECGIVGGKRKRISRRIKGTKADAKLLESELIKKVKKGELIESKNLTLNELADIFLKDYCEVFLKANTIYNYENLLIKIRERLGSVHITSITPYTLQSFYKGIFESGVSQNTVRHYYKLLNNMFEHAVKWQFLESNPNKYIEQPRKVKKEIRVYSLEQVKDLLNALEKEPICYRAPIILCLDTGMRREELNGLTWSDVDFENDTVSINKVRLAVNKKILIETPKTISSNRKIKVTKETMRILKELKIFQEKQAFLLKNKWHNTGYLFVNCEGDPYYPDTLSKIFKKIQKRHNLPELNLHELRHTNASLLIELEEDIKNVSVRLGHGNISTTLNTYTHAIENAENSVIHKLDSILKK